MDWIYGVIAFVSLTVVLTMIMLIKRKQNWSGIVLGVKNETVYDDDRINATDYITIKIKTDSGKTIRKRVKEYWFLNKYPNGIHVGDKIVKNSGDDMFQLVA